MKKFSLSGAVLLLGIVLAFKAEAGKITDMPVIDASGNQRDHFVGWVPNEFVVQLTPAATVTRFQNLKSQTNLAATLTGLAELNQMAEQFEVDKFEKEFVDAQPQPLGSLKPDLSGYFIVRFNRGNLEEAMAAFAQRPEVDHVEPIGIHRVDFAPNDSSIANQWALEQSADHDIDAFAAWDIQKGSTNVVLANLDTGVRYYHKDLGGHAWTGGASATGTTGNIWINTLDPVDGLDNDGNGFVDDHIGWDFVNFNTACGYPGCWVQDVCCIPPCPVGDPPPADNEDCFFADNNPDDYAGHGTHTAGTMAAITNNARGVAGVTGGNAGGTTDGIGNGCKIMCLRIGWLGGDGFGYVRMDYAAQALNYAAGINNNPSQPAKVVVANASWGSGNSGGIQAAYQNVIAAGILFVKAAGNDDSSTPDFLNGKPGDSTLAVAAIDSSDRRAIFSTYSASNYGDWVDASAPGKRVLSTLLQYVWQGGYIVGRTDAYAYGSGTSMSAPHVAGLAGLLKSQNSSLSRHDIYFRIKTNSEDIDSLNPGYENQLGLGRINAHRVLTYANCLKAKGDMNGSGTYSGSDIVCLQQCVNNGTSSCGCGLCYADMNCDGLLTSVDVTILINLVFNEQPPPC